MANEIAAQFGHLSDDAVVDAVAEHLRSFWDPRMRSQLAGYVAGGGEGVDPRVTAAVALLDTAR